MKQTRTNSTGLEVVIGRHVGEQLNVPAIAMIHPEGKPYWNDEYNEYWAYQLFSIRKLMENECLRLMDVPEDLIVRICKESGLAKSAIYKLAGNSIVCACLRLIFHQIKRQFPMAWTGGQVNLITLCSGYDSQMIALRQFCEEYNITSPGTPLAAHLMAWSEFDPESKRPLGQQPAVVAHNTLFPEYADRNLGDMTKIDWAAWKEQAATDDSMSGECDLLTYSTPCQSISQAGKCEGMKEGSGTRSSIVFFTENAIRELRPKFLLQENVQAITNRKNMPDFQQWQQRVEALGYTNFYTIMNAKDFGVPQNRCRMFMLSVRNDILQECGINLNGDLFAPKSFDFPTPFPLTRCIADILDEDCDPSYFLKPDSVLKFLQKNEEDSQKGIIYAVVDHHLTEDELKEYWNVG